MKRRRRIVLTLAGVAALLIFLWIIWPDDQGPYYQGKTLAEYVRTIDEVEDSNPEFKVAVNAVQQIGTNGLPFLLKQIDHEPSAWRAKLDRRVPRTLMHKFPKFYVWIICDTGTRRADAALNVFTVLGEKAAPAIPALTNLLRAEREYSSGRALVALACVGTNGLVEVLRVATNVSDAKDLRSLALVAIGAFATNAPFVIPPLIQLLDDVRLGPGAATALGELKLQPAVVVPELAKRLHSEDSNLSFSAATALAYYGPAATGAIPDLLDTCTNEIEEVRIAATNALSLIAPEVYKAPEH